MLSLEMMIVSYTVPEYTYVEIFSTCYLFIPLSGVTIGFNITEYSIRENASIVSAIVSVLNGTLARDVSVSVFTTDDSAGERNK